VNQDLLTAVYRQDMGAIKRLTESGIDMNERDKDGRTVLMHAVLAENAESGLVKYLISSGVDVDASDKAQQWTALHFAARDQKPEIVRALIEGGAQIDPVDVFGNTPLWRCVMISSPNETVVRILLESGADPDKTNYAGNSPRDLAANSGDQDVLEMLARRGRG
jgi:ankyrin repeat protein